MENTRQPEKKFSAGPISAAVWKNSGKNKEGQEVEYRTVTLQRGYKDKNDEWQNTSSLRVNDLPRAELVLRKAYEYIVLRDTTDAVSIPEKLLSSQEQAYEEIVM